MSTYIINENLQQRFGSFEIIEDFDTALNAAIFVSAGNNLNAKIGKSYIKEYFLKELSKRTDITIVNCNCNENIFKDSLKNASGLIVFDNISKCKLLNDICNIDKKILLI